jgi:WD40 repeat protein
METDPMIHKFISPVGDYFYIITDEDGLIAFDMKGNKRWTLKEIDLAANPKISPDGQFIYFEGQKDLEIYTNNGKFHSRYDFEKRIRLMDISDDSKFFAVGEDKKLYIYDIESGNIIWDYDLREDLISKYNVMGIGYLDLVDKVEITPIVVSGVQKVGLGPSDYEFSKYIRFLDKKGNKVYEKYLGIKGSSIPIMVSPSNDVAICFVNKIYFFTIEKR